MNPRPHAPGAAVLLINSLATGGAERAIASAAARLARQGRDIRVVILESVPAESAPDVPFRVARLSRMGTAANALRKLLALPVLAACLRRYVDRENVDVVMSHLFRANFVNILAKLLARSRHKAIVVNHTRVSRLSSEGLQGRINWMLCRWLYPRADLVASVSAGGAREAGRLLGLRSDQCVTLYDPIDVAAASAGTPQAENAIVCVGRLVPLKRFQDVIIAFARVALGHPGLQLRIVGDGPEREALRRLSEKVEVAQRVTFFGTIRDPARVVAGCACFVSASETEGFGMAIVEALAAGVPVIASDCAYGPREILSPSTDPGRLLEPDADIEIAPFGILFPVGSVNALEKALRRVLGDASLRADLYRKGPGRAADFSVDRSSTEYERLLFPA